MLETGAKCTNTDSTGVDVYGQSLAADKLRACLDTGSPLRVACLDIDSTLTGDPALANSVRNFLEAHGWVVTFVTSRTEEMVMSATTYLRTRETLSFSRPRPQLGEVAGRRVYRPPEEHEPRGLLDGDLIAGSSGTRLLVRQRDGAFLPDPIYVERAGQSPERWREGVQWLVTELRTGGYRVDLAGIEYPENYAAGRSDIYPPDYRIQLNFPSLVDKQRTVTALAAVRCELAQRGGRHAAVARNVRRTDDSHPGKSGYKLFLTPRRLSKAHAAERLIAGLCGAVSLDRCLLTVLFAGDSFPDLKMGLFGALGTNATLLLVGGSRLLAGLTGPEETHFAGEPLAAIRRRLSATGDPGVYRFRLPMAEHDRRTLIIGDQRFPGTGAVETVHAYLESTSAPFP